MFSLPGLEVEMKDELEKESLTIDMMEEYTVKEWKHEVLTIVEKRNKEELLTKLRHCKKINIDEINDEMYGTKEYLKNLPYSDALLAFRIRAGVQRNIRTHYKNA